MDANQIISTSASFASIGALGLAATAAIYSLYKYLYRAKFRILLLPEELSNLEGNELDSSHVDELRIAKKSSIAEIHTERHVHSKRVAAQKKRLFSKDRRAKIAFLIQNVGNRESGNTKLILRFDNPDIQVSDLHTETFDVEHFYNSRPQEVKSQLLKSKNMDSVILHYYEQLNMTAAHLSMETTFSGGAFELVVMEVTFTEDAEQFTSIFRIECVNAFLKRQVLVQCHELVYS